MLIKRSVSDSNGQFLYSVLQSHCSKASAAGKFQAITKGSLILTKNQCDSEVVVKCENGDIYSFSEVV